MNKFLFALYVLVTFPFLAIAQVWPLNIPNLPRGCSPSMNTATCTKTAVLNNGDWKNPNTWSPAGLPGVDDIVCIPINITVQVNTPTYDAVSTQCGNTFTNNINTPRLAILVGGTIDFKAGGKLNLGCGSALSILPSSGKILAANGNSDQIQIGDRVVWGGANNVDINAPANITYGGIGQGVLNTAFKSIAAKIQSPFQASVSWQTSSEINSSEFILEKSADAVNWISVHTISAKGTNNSESAYVVIDYHLLRGTTYYRVKEVNHTGIAEYSSVTSVLNNPKGNITIYPNPAVSSATLYMNDVLNNHQIIQLHNINGALIQNLNYTGGNTLRFNTTHLSPGLYLIRITENGKTISEIKLLKQ